MSGQTQRLNVVPTVTVLGVVKARLVGATRGHALLKKKSDALTMQFRQILKKIVSTKESMGDTMKTSSFALTEAKYVAGENIKHVVHENVSSAALKVRSYQEYFIDGETKNDLTGLARGGQQIQACLKIVFNHQMLNKNEERPDPNCDHHHPESITLLKDQGINFAKNKSICINPRTFARKFHQYGLGRMLTWITFHGLYDYGYLIRILTGRRLPYSYEEFTTLKQSIFGLISYDTRDMAKQLGLYRGLEIAKSLNADRVAMKSHQAGSDSLLIMHVFLKLTTFVPEPCPLAEQQGDQQGVATRTYRNNN